jgi:hypothetical protein
MNYTRALPLLFLLCSTTFSQTPGTQFSSKASQANCPLELTASFYVAGKPPDIEPIENGQTTRRDQRLQITLDNPKSDVASALIRVYGYPVGGRVAPAVLYFPHDPAEITKTIAFDRAVGARHAATIDISVRDFSTVNSIDLNAMTYSDGSIWRPAENKSCRAVGSPSGPLPVGAAATRR